MNASEVKTGNRVLYSDGTKEFEGLATSDAHLGVHPGAKRANFYINLIYLNDAGEAAKVMGSALLSAAVTPEDKARIAAKEFSARAANPSSAAVMTAKQMTIEDVSAELAATPVTIGWRPKADENYDANQAATIKILQEQLDETAKQLAEAMAENEKLNHEMNQPPQPAPEQAASADEPAVVTPTPTEPDMVAELEKAAALPAPAETEPATEAAE